MIFAEAPFAECHASTLAQTPQGWAAAWFGGTHEKHPDVGIWLSLRDGDGPWSAPERIAKIDETAHWNPVLFGDPSGTLHLWFKTGSEIPHWKTFTQTSYGWRANLERGAGVGSGRRDGRTRAGEEQADSCSRMEHCWRAHRASKEPGRRSSTAPRTAARPGRGRRTSIERRSGRSTGAFNRRSGSLQPGIVHALVRSSCGFLARADSTDGGRTWSPLYDSGLPNNNSGIDLARLPDGTLALIYNPVSDDWGARSPLRVSLSFDNGKTWPDLPGFGSPSQAVSSPIPPSSPSGESELAVTYTWKRVPGSGSGGGASGNASSARARQVSGSHGRRDPADNDGRPQRSRSRSRRPRSSRSRRKRSSREYRSSRSYRSKRRSSQRSYCRSFRFWSSYFFAASAAPAPSNNAVAESPLRSLSESGGAQAHADGRHQVSVVLPTLPLALCEGRLRGECAENRRGRPVAVRIAFIVIVPFCTGENARRRDAVTEAIPTGGDSSSTRPSGWPTKARAARLMNRPTSTTPGRFRRALLQKRRAADDPERQV